MVWIISTRNTPPEEDWSKLEVITRTKIDSLFVGRCECFQSWRETCIITKQIFVQQRRARCSFNRCSLCVGRACWLRVMTRNFFLGFEKPNGNQACQQTSAVPLNNINVMALFERVFAGPCKCKTFGRNQILSLTLFNVCLFARYKFAFHTKKGFRTWCWRRELFTKLICKHVTMANVVARSLTPELWSQRTNERANKQNILGNKMFGIELHQKPSRWRCWMDAATIANWWANRFSNTKLYAGCLLENDRFGDNSKCIPSPSEWSGTNWMLRQCNIIEDMAILASVFTLWSEQLVDAANCSPWMQPNTSEGTTSSVSFHIIYWNNWMAI